VKKKVLGKKPQVPPLTLEREVVARLTHAVGGVEDHTVVGFCSARVACTN
jgi:hypothetical protein